ncbi:MAG: methylenetetrahydrofolate reductase [Clostridia bacterium]|nr:methylenetetrahydrofolate reductase [NAD(P)H] [Clostridia bacterium]
MLSFEVFPPKTETVFKSVSEAALQVAALHPDFISVTYGAGGGTSQYTLDLAREIHEKTGVEPLAHLTCVSSSRETVRARIEEIHSAGIQNVMALRGDPPVDGVPGTDYHHASDLITELRASGYDFCIGGACYPEVHPESENQKADIAALREKARVGCDFLTTQMFFDNHLLFNFLYKIREAGITIPVFPGIMPITSKKQVKQVMRLSNASLPQRFRSLMDRYGDSEEAMCQAGIIYATDQIIDLYANGIQVVHVYTMNKPAIAAAIKQNLSVIIGMPL